LTRGFTKGYDAATIIEIARACGYNKRSIYLYFRDKEELFLAVVLRGLEQLHTRLEKAAGLEDIRFLCLPDGGGPHFCSRPL